MAIRRIVAGWFLGAFSLLAAAADETPPNEAIPQAQGVRQLLQMGWSHSYAAREQADQLHNTLQAQHGVQTPVEYAYALALLHQGRFSESLEQVKLVSKLRPEDDAAQAMLIRNLMVLKSYDAAIQESQKIAEKWREAEAAAAEADRRAAQQSLAYLLGVVCGFLEGPADAATLQAKLQGLIAIQETWPEPLRQSFGRGREHVTTTFADYQRELAGVADENETEVARKEQMLSADLEKRQQQAELDRAAWQREAEKVREDARGRLDAVTAELRPLAASYSDLERQVVAIRVELAPILLDLDRLEARLADTENPFERDLLLRQIARLERIAIRWQTDLAALRGQAGVLESQMARLQQEQVAVQAQLASDQQRLARREASLAKAERIAEADRRKLQRGLEAPRGGLISLGRQASAYTSYDSFNLESHRQVVEAMIR